VLTLITVSYNCAEKTLELLRSLERQTDQNFDVIVVDNDSAPADRGILGEYAASSPLKLDIIYSDTNRGFSGGNNLAIRKALAQGSEYVFLINPDITVDAGFISAIRGSFSDNEIKKSVEICGVFLDEGQRHTAFAGKIQWLKATLPHIYDYEEFRNLQFSEKIYAIGAGILVDRQVFEKIGFLDERYFLYFEDADFCMRARQNGIPTRFIQGIKITHGVSQSTQQLGSPLLLRYHMRNAHLFNWTHGPLWVKIALPFWSFLGIVKQLSKILLMPSRRTQSRAIAAGIIDFYAQKFGHIKKDWHRM
jgi:GT2 family glycosyltransferase